MMSSLYPQGMTLKALLENPSLLKPPTQKKQDEDRLKGKDDSNAIDFGSAFLGPTLWDNTLPYSGNDFKLEYLDLDEFLSENGIPINSAASPSVSLPRPQINNPPSSPHLPQSLQSPYLTTTVVLSPTGSAVSSPQHSPVCSPQRMDGSFHEIGRMNPNKQIESPITTPNMSPFHQSLDMSQMSPSQNSRSSWVEQQHHPMVDIEDDSSAEIGKRAKKLYASCDQVVIVPGQEGFDPKQHQFSQDELKPQPMIKKSRKVFVPTDLKDDKYWARREKNNVAAKRSRDARRVKENQIAMRAAFLEDEHMKMKNLLEAAQRENKTLKEKLAKYEKWPEYSVNSTG